MVAVIAYFKLENMAKVKSKAEKDREAQIKRLVSILKNQGVIVRREKLTRGVSFRVKSGSCMFSGENIVFVDKRMSSEQQLSILREFCSESRIAPATESLAAVS